MSGYADDGTADAVPLQNDWRSTLTVKQLYPVRFTESPRDCSISSNTADSSRRKIAVGGIAHHHTECGIVLSNSFAAENLADKIEPGWDAEPWSSREAGSRHIRPGY